MIYRDRKHTESETPGIPLSPLIDCVFLLLIFFLVATMLKRKETIIPVVMPDSASAITAEAQDRVIVVGLDPDGQFLEPAERDPYGALTFARGRALEQYLDDMIKTTGPAVFQQAIRFDIARETPFQETINALDVCKLRGFNNVSVKIRPSF